MPGDLGHSGHPVAQEFTPARSPVSSGLQRDNVPAMQLRPIHLREAIAMALGQSDIIRTLDGIESVTQLDPLIAEANADAEFGRFAPDLRLRYEGSQIDQPPESFFGPGISTNTRYDEGDLIAELNKRWPLGTSTRLAYDPASLGYLFVPEGETGDSFNPAWGAAGVFEVRQPLLRGAGRIVNLAPIRIAQAKTTQSHWEVEAATISQIRSVEQAYWELQAAQVAWQAVHSVLPLAQEAVRIQELRYRAERTIYADLARTKVQLERFRQQSAAAKFRVAERENQLRQLIGVDAGEGPPLVTADLPRTEEVAIDCAEAVDIAVLHRPDLHQSRSEIERLNWERLAAANATLPQLDARYQYRTNGLANRLDDAFQQAGTLDYSDWTIGLEFSIPLGNRQARSKLLAREREVARERARLRELERQVGFEIALLAAELQSRWEQATSASRQAAEAQEWVRLATIRYSNPPADDGSRNVLLAALDDFQTALQAHIDARSDAAKALADYNITLVRIEEAQGTLLERWNIQFAGGDIAGPSGAHRESRSTPSVLQSYRSQTHDSTFGHALFYSSPGAQQPHRDRPEIVQSRRTQ